MLEHEEGTFLDVVSHLRYGKTEKELREALSKLVKDCRETGKKGSLTLRIDVLPEKGENGDYQLDDKVIIKEPPKPRSPTIFHGTPEGKLLLGPGEQDSFDFEKGDGKNVVKIT